MAQATVCLAFRKRLSNRGYTDIHIELSHDDVYIVSALEPLAGFRVQCEMDLHDMYVSMRR